MKGRAAINLKDRVFDRLAVLERAGSQPNGGALWLCRCTCGTQRVVASGSLISGATRSCGCLFRERLAAYNAVMVAKRKAASKTKYTCPDCGVNAWAKPLVALICGDCDQPLLADGADQ